MTKARCDACGYFTLVTGVEGTCRRAAPRPGPAADAAAVGWPVVRVDDWCGEYYPSAAALTGEPTATTATWPMPPWLIGRWPR
jgi:hypothetical protein